MFSDLLFIAGKKINQLSSELNLEEYCDDIELIWLMRTQYMNAPFFSHLKAHVSLLSLSVICHGSKTNKTKTSLFSHLKCMAKVIRDLSPILSSMF